jgi:DNA-directed RNA polymerase subunit RPC12/RpoP
VLSFAKTKDFIILKYVCFGCRKVFKRKLLTDIFSKEQTEEKDAMCPHCGNPSHYIGPKFRAPKREDKHSWSSLEVLKELKMLHFWGWANNPIKLPASKKQLKEMLVEMKKEYECAVKNWLSADYDESNKKHLTYVSKKLEEVKKQIE